MSADDVRTAQLSAPKSLVPLEPAPSSTPSKSNPPPLQPRTRTPKPLEPPGPKAAAAMPAERRQPAPLAAPSSRGGSTRSSITSTSPTAPVQSFGASKSLYRATSDIASAARQAPSKPEHDKEELTTKGRKRKRLAKACSACHKNKRRCDGFAPCSNCEFSARPCIYLNAQGEQIPPPRTRDSSLAPVTNKPPNDEGNPAGGSLVPGGPLERRPSNSNPGGPPRRPSGDDWGRREYRDGAERSDFGDWRNGERRGGFTPLDVVDRDPAISAELLDIFFKRTPPYSGSFHVPTFYYRHYMNRVSPMLLDAIYCLGARLCENPTFVGSFPSSVPSYLRGQTFADRCRLNLDRVIDMRQHWSDDDRRMDQGTWEETEYVQTCLLLSVFFNSTRQSRIGLFYLDEALSVLHPSGGQLPLPSPRLNLSQAEYYTLAEIRGRTFWLCVLGDMCAAASGRQIRIMDHDLAGVPLPGPEVYWYRYGGMGVGGREPGRRDSLVVGTGNWHTEDGQIGELGHIIRIFVIFSSIMALANSGGVGSHEVRHLPPSHFEQALKSWALELPRHLCFDEVNLSISMAKINSPLPEVAFGGWAFAYMHVVAECGMFYLQSKHAGAPFVVQRQGQAVDNLTVIVDSLGERGREGPLMFFAVMIITCWTDHVRATSPNATQANLDERLNSWWVQTFHEWGWDRRETLEKGIFRFSDNSPMPTPALSRPFPGAPPSTLRPSVYDPQPPSSLGLYQSPQGRPVEQNPSPGSHLPGTPVSGDVPPYPAASNSGRYPLLPPLRARDSTAPFPPPRSPSPGRTRRIGSISSSGGEGRDFNLPPLGPSYPTKGPGAMPLVDREWNRDDKSDKAKESRNHTNNGEPRPLQPPHKRPWSSNGNGGPLLGIDALISAAEEHRRESLAEATTTA